MTGLACLALVSDWECKVEKNDVALANGEKWDEIAITVDEVDIKIEVEVQVQEQNIVCMQVMRILKEEFTKM